MSEQVLVQARVDKKLKDEVSEMYVALGMDFPTAIRMFLVKSKEERGLPFVAVLPPKQSAVSRDDSLALFDRRQAMASSFAGDMTEEDIEKEIKTAIKDYKSKKQ